MILSVSSIVGLPGLPTTNRGARDWLKRQNIPLTQDGKRFSFCLADLPHSVRLALSARQIEAEGLEPGERDEAAHARLYEVSPKMQAKAAHEARMAVFMVRREADGWAKADIFTAVHKAFDGLGTSDSTLFRILKAVKGVAPANFAPALLDNYNMAGRPCGPNWDEAGTMV